MVVIGIWNNKWASTKSRRACFP